MLTEKTFDTGELTLAYLENDSAAPPMLLLHGLTGWRSDWENLVPFLEADWHIFMPELRGHGNSARGEAYRLIDYSRDIIALMHSIGQPVVLVGFSLGALVAMTVAAQYPAGVSRLVLLDPPLYTGVTKWNALQAGWKDYFVWVRDALTDMPSYETLMERVEATFPTEGNTALLKAMTDQYFRVAPGTVAAAVEDRLWDVLDFDYTLGNIPLPTLVLHGDWEYGGVMRGDDIALLKRRFPAAKIVRLAGAGHVLPIENPKTVFSEMTLFLNPA